MTLLRPSTLGPRIAALAFLACFAAASHGQTRFTISSDGQEVTDATTKAWRIPTKDELVTLVDKAAKKKPRIDVKAFPQTPSQPFWAMRPGSDDDLNAWLVNFANGKVHGNTGQRKLPLRIVRASA